MTSVAGIPYSVDPTVQVHMLAGQSNPRGAAAANTISDPSVFDPFPAVRMFHDVGGYDPSDGATEDLDDLNGSTPAAPGAAIGWGPELRFGRLVHATRPPLSTVCILKVAEGGTSLRFHWRPTAQGGSAPGEWLTRLLDAWTSLRAVLQSEYPDASIVPASFLWVQGESDATNTTSSTEYEANLSALLAEVRAHVGRVDLPARVVRLHEDLDPVTFPESADVRAAMEAVAAADEHTEVVIPDALELRSDLTHYTADALSDASASIAQLLADSL